MLRKVSFLILIGLVVMLSASAADAALLSIIHAVPGEDGDLKSNTPVDIEIAGVCEFTRKFYGDKLGPYKVNKGKYKITVHAHKQGAPCKGAKLGSKTLKLKKKSEIDAAIHLKGSGVTITPFSNKKSLRPVLDGEWASAVEVRHVAQAGRVAATVSQSGTEVGSGEVAAGKALVPIQTGTGEHEIVVAEASTTIDQVAGRIKRGHAYWAYVAGSTSKGNAQLLVYESIALEEPPRGGGGDGGKPPKNLNACCIGGSCSPLDFNTCSISTGTYYGEVGCHPNPCR